MDLNTCREKIDAIDAQLVRLFEERMDVCAQIAEYKKANGLPILDSAREREKLDSVAGHARPELADSICELYKTIFALSRAYQRKLNKGE